MKYLMTSGVLAALLGTGFAGGAFADPLVIPGFGPAEAQAVQSRAQAAARPAPPAPRQVAQLAPPQGGGYGGGFFELLATGGRPPGAAAPQPVAYTPASASAGSGYGQPYGSATVETAPAHEVDPIYRRQEVAFAGAEHPGTIIIDTPNKFLFLVEPGGRALRYGIGVGRPGFAWAGVKTITRKAEWPGWTPPPEMIKRRPDLPAHMDGGPANPLGARAMYLGSSLYRIHGTNEPYTIGTNVSSGCIRLMNEDVMDLYERVGVGTKVVVL